MNEQPIITKSGLIADLRALGLAKGQMVMLHASVRNIGWIVGGPDIVLEAILDVLTPEGTLLMMVGWEHGTYEMAEWSEEKRRAYLEECPPYDPARSRACRDWGMLAEYIRTWPGARRSRHPDSSFVAIGRLAEWAVDDHPLNYGYGLGSPLAKLCEAGGHVLILGSPLEDITLLHHSESLAKVLNKPIYRYQEPVLQNEKRVWIDIEEFDTNLPIGPWGSDHYFELIAREFISKHPVKHGKVGTANSYLFDARKLNSFGVNWLEQTFCKY